MSHVCACGFCSPSMMSDGCQHEATLQAVQKERERLATVLELLLAVAESREAFGTEIAKRLNLTNDSNVVRGTEAARSAIDKARAALDSLTEARRSGAEGWPCHACGVLTWTDPCHYCSEARRSEPDA